MNIISADVVRYAIIDTDTHQRFRVNMMGDVTVWSDDSGWKRIWVGYDITQANIELIRQRGVAMLDKHM